MTTLTESSAAELFRQAPDRMLDVGIAEAAYRRVGTGPDVLFVHGWPVSGATWRRLLPLLADHVTCHIVDLPGAGDSRFLADAPLSVQSHIESVRAIVDLLELDDVAVVGHDSGGMIARHAVAGDPRLRAMGLVNTEMPSGLDWRFRSFLALRRVPGVAGILGWLVGQPTLRRNGFVLGDAFADKSLLDGEFDEFFLQPIHTDAHRRAAAIKVLKSFDENHVNDLAEVHARIDVPVQMVWGAEDPFFPIAKARDMVGTFADANLVELDGVGLFSHEEAPERVAAALLPTLTGG